MPSGAKRRKAAQKKKMKMTTMEEVVEVLGGDSEVFDVAGGLQEGDDDLKTQEERDTDSSSGDTGSPASEDQHDPFDGRVEECEKADLVSAPVDSVDNSVSAPVDSVDNSVEEANGDDCVVQLEIKDERNSKVCGETGFDATEGWRSPVSEDIKELDETELLSVRRDSEEITDKETNGDIDGGVEKVYPGTEESNMTEEAANGDAFDAHQSVLLPNGYVKIVNGTEKEDYSEEKTIDIEGSGLAVESDNLMSLLNELADSVNWLPEATSFEAAPLTSMADPATLLENDDVSGASPLKERDDSYPIMKAPKDRSPSAIHIVSGVDIPNLTMNDVDDKLLPVGVDKTGTPEDGSKSDGEQMPSSGCLIAKIENGAEKCNATLVNNDTGSELKENSVAKLENGPDASNLAAIGNKAVMKENGHGDAPILGDVIAQNGHCKERNNDLEDAHNNIDNQHELPKVHRVLRKTSWMGCCGLFDVITGSVR